MAWVPQRYTAVQGLDHTSGSQSAGNVDEFSLLKLAFCSCGTPFFNMLVCWRDFGRGAVVYSEHLVQPEQQLGISSSIWEGRTTEFLRPCVRIFLSLTVVWLIGTLESEFGPLCCLWFCAGTRVIFFFFKA